MKKILLTTILLTISLMAELKIGDTFPQTSLNNQFNKPMRVELSDEVVILSFEKDVSLEINKFLKSKPKEFMLKKHIKYISDISSVPSFLSSIFAIPKLKKLPFLVMLIEDNFGEQFKKKDKKVTIYILKDNKILNIKFLDPKNLSKFIK